MLQVVKDKVLSISEDMKNGVTGKLINSHDDNKDRIAEPTELYKSIMKIRVNLVEDAFNTVNISRSLFFYVVNHIERQLDGVILSSKVYFELISMIMFSIKKNEEIQRSFLQTQLMLM